MKKKYLDLLIIIINIFILIELFIKKELIFKTIGYSLNIWIKTIVPSLFPFFIISEILISYNIINYIPSFIKKSLSYLFNVSENAIIVFLLSLISGFPSNAKNTKLLYQKKLITESEASHILMFTHFANPLFIISTIGTFFLQNEKLAIIILISHYLSNFVLGIISRNLNNVKKKELYNNNSSMNFGNIFINSIKHSIDSLFTILGTLTCFLIVSNIICNIFNLDLYSNMLIKGIFEITMGLKELGSLPLSPLYKTVITTVLLSFGGLSVHMQVIAQIYDTTIKYKYFLIGRIFQAIISGIVSFLIFIIFY